MTHQSSIVHANRLDRDLYRSSQVGERVLNSAIIQTKISESFEKYLEIFDAFYADDIEVSSEGRQEPIRGRERLRSLLYSFLIPLHVMAEIGGFVVSIRTTAIPGDVAGETNSVWTLDLADASGTARTLSWHTLRRWNGARIAYEYHSDIQQNGWPVLPHDFRFDAEGPAQGLRRPS
jgi:hypothetical protein